MVRAQVWFRQSGSYPGGRLDPPGRHAAITKNLNNRRSYRAWAEKIRGTREKNKFVHRQQARERGRVRITGQLVVAVGQRFMSSVDIQGQPKFLVILWR